MKICIPESIPSLNKGEMAIFEGIKEALTNFHNPEISLYCAWPEIDSARFGADIKTVGGVDLYQMADYYNENPPTSFRWSVYIKRWGKLVIYTLLSRLSKRLAAFLIKDELLATYVNADLLMVGHDGCLNVELFWFVITANILKIPIAIYGVGTEGKPVRIKRFYYRFMLRYAFLHTIFNSVRESGSVEYLLANNIPRDRFFLFPDPAILMKPSPEKEITALLAREKIPDEKDQPLFGLITVRGGVIAERSFTAEKDPLKKHELRVSFWKNLVEFLILNTNAHFLFIPHCIGPSLRNDDRVTAGEITERLSNLKNRFTFITNEYSAPVLKGLMGRCDFIVGERTHGLLGALSFPTPCIALTVKEDRRMHNVVNEMFGRTTLNLNEPDINDIQTRIVSEWNNRASIREEMLIKKQEAVSQAQSAARILRERFETCKN